MIFPRKDQTKNKREKEKKGVIEQFQYESADTLLINFWNLQGTHIRVLLYKIVDIRKTNVRCSSSDPNLKDNILWKVAVF